MNRFLGISRLIRRSSSFPKPEKPAASGTATAVVGAVGAVIVGGGCYFMYRERNVSGLSYAHKLAIQKVMDSEDLGKLIFYLWSVQCSFFRIEIGQSDVLLLNSF